MPYSIKIIRELEELDPKLRGVFLAILEEIERNVKETVKKSDFDELKQIVAQLGKQVNELAEAQKRTEKRVDELAEAQKRTEQRVNELAEAQKRTEKRVDELAEAQKRTEKRLEELAHAQKRTEEELRALIKEHKVTRELVANLADTVGYGLEDKIIPYIPSFAKRQYGIDIYLVERRNIIYPDGRYDEINLYAEGSKDNEKVYLAGECKSKPGKKDIDRFVSTIKRLKAHLNAPVYPFMVAYTYNPEVEIYIRDKYPDIKTFKSYEFDPNYIKNLK